MFLPSCPHCGAAVRPLWQRLRDNRNAAVLAAAAVVCLSVALTLPFLTVSQFGTRQTYSLPGGIRDLYRRDHVFLAAVLLVFSVLFPYAKLLAILTATSALVPLRQRVRRGLHRLADLTARYSLLDILVVAVMIVVIKSDGLLEARALGGTILFCVAVLLSILAGLCAGPFREAPRP
jgi:paraquat-inducible protein A